MRSVLLPRALSFGRGDRSGSTLVSAVVAAGVSTVGLLATLSLITTSMKAGRRAQGLADAGALGDSIRTVFRANPGAGCSEVFSPAVGTNLQVPAGGGGGSPPSVAVTTLQIPASAVNPSPSPLVSVGDVRGAIRVTGMTLTRLAPGQMRLRIQAEKVGEQLGGNLRDLEFDLLATFDSGSSQLTGCSYAGSGSDAAQAASSVPQAIVKFDTPGTTSWTVPEGVTRIRVKCWGAGGGGSPIIVGLKTWGPGVGGGGGAYSEGIFSVSAGAVLSVTTGTGGARGAWGSLGGADGSASQVSGLLQCQGGQAGSIFNSSPQGGSGGSCASSTASLCIPGQMASVSNGGGSGMGGSGGNSGRYLTATLVGVDSGVGSSPGGGGAGGTAPGNNTAHGSPGANGLILIEY